MLNTISLGIHKSLSSSAFTATSLCFIVKKTRRPYLEVAHHDESSTTDPARAKTRRVQDTVLMLLNDVGVAKQHNHHHYKKGDESHCMQEMEKRHHLAFFGRLSYKSAWLQFNANTLTRHLAKKYMNSLKAILQEIRDVKQLL